MPESLTPEFKEKMAQDAKAATQGEWEAFNWGDGDCEVVKRIGDHVRPHCVARPSCEADAQHIANCDPQTILALLKENARLNESVRAFIGPPPGWQSH